MKWGMFAVGVGSMLATIATLLLADILVPQTPALVFAPSMAFSTVLLLYAVVKFQKEIEA